MTLDELIVLFGVEVQDEVEPYLFDEEDRIALLDEAVKEACLRKNLLFDDSTAEICEIAVTTPVYEYALNEVINRITQAYVVCGSEYYYLTPVSRDELDRVRPRWREDSVDDPIYLLVDEKTVRLVPPPSQDGTLHLEVYRVPLESEYMAVTLEEPVIAETHQYKLIFWAAYRALNRPDADYYAPDEAARCLTEFEDYFGLRPDADRLRESRENRPHRNKLWI